MCNCRLARSVGAKVVVEPRKKERRDRKENKKRPDTVVELPGRKWWTDETILHPYNPTNEHIIYISENNDMASTLRHAVVVPAAPAPIWPGWT